MATPDSKPNLEEVARIKIVTWNPNVSPDDLKIELFSRIQTFKTLVCLQEVTEEFVSNISNCENLENSYAREKETLRDTFQAVFIHKSGSVYVTDCEDSELEIPTKVCDLSKLRCSGKLVTHKQSKKSFILVSYHGKRNRSQKDLKKGPLSDEEKKPYLESFITEMRNVAKHYNLIVIVGGDFNYEVIKWKTKIEEEFAGKVVVAPLYAGVPNRRHVHNVIDTFIAVYPDDYKNGVITTCKFDIPIPICMFPTKGYIGDDETKILNYPNNVCPCCKVLYYNNKDLQTLKEILEPDNFEESCKDNTTDTILPLWPRCTFLKEFNHDPVMVTVELVSHRSTNYEGFSLEEQNTSSQSQPTNTSMSTFSPIKSEKSLDESLSTSKNTSSQESTPKSAPSQSRREKLPALMKASIPKSTSTLTQSKLAKSSGGSMIIANTPKSTSSQSRIKGSSGVTASTPNESQSQRDDVEPLELKFENLNLGEDDEKHQNN